MALLIRPRCCDSFLSWGVRGVWTSSCQTDSNFTSLVLIHIHQEVPCHAGNVLLSSWPFPCYHPFPLCTNLYHCSLLTSFPLAHSSPLLSIPTAPVSFPTTVFYPSLRCSLLTSLLSSTHSSRNKHCNENLYWIIVFAISLWVDSVIAFIHQGLCESDPPNPAFAFPQRIPDDLSIKKLQRFSRDG